VVRVGEPETEAIGSPHAGQKRPDSGTAPEQAGHVIIAPF